jgi:hypothetical protein
MGAAALHDVALAAVIVGGIVVVLVLLGLRE